MSTLFLAFANSENSPLSSLREEDEKVNALLSERASRDDYHIVREQYATVKKIADQLPLYKEGSELFLYSGHAGRDRLVLEEGDAHSAGIAALLGQCPNLKIVVLNGCSTAGQVSALLAAGVPVVIATNAPVNDTSATLFSTTFFSMLAKQNSSIREAFDMGLAAAKMINPNIQNRSILKIGEKADNEAWAIYTNVGRDSIADEWRLPSTVVAERKPFTPNVLLIDKALQGLAHYNTEAKVLVDNEKMGIESDVLDKRAIILKCYPHPVSEQLRKLMVPERNTGAVFYDKISAARLQQLVVTYNTLTILLTYILLAQLWSEKVQRELAEKSEDLTTVKKKHINISPEHATVLKHFFSLDHLERQGYNFIALLRLLRQIFDDNEVLYFIEEIKGFNRQLAAQSAFFETFDFFETLKKRKPATSEADIAFLCEKAERQLATILGEFGFMTLYEMASVKNITVLKYRHVEKATFKHQLIKLEQRFVGLAATDVPYNNYLEASSILFQRKGLSPPQYVNLTPLVIDENAYNERADLAKLHFFERYEPLNGTYFFRHIYNPDDRLLEVNAEMDNKPFFHLINAQFEDFAESFFNKKVTELG